MVNIDPQFCRTIISFYSMQKHTLFTDSSADRLDTSQLLVLSHLSINEKQIENNQKKTKTGERQYHIRAQINSLQADASTFITYTAI